jgi:hypothetical protein
MMIIYYIPYDVYFDLAVVVTKGFDCIQHSHEVIQNEGRTYIYNRGIEITI